MKTPMDRFLERHIFRGRDPNRKPGEYPGPETELGQKRMAEDVEKIRHPERWPMKVQLFVKSQPWITQEHGFRHGAIRPDQLTVVAVNGNGDTLERFESIEELVKTWSVD